MAHTGLIDDIPPHASEGDDRLGDVLSGSSWFSALDASLQSDMRANLVMRSCEAGQPISYQGERTPGLFMVISGQVQTIGTAIDGLQTLISIQRAGDWSGFVGAFDEQANSFAIVAMEPCTIALLPQSKVRELFFQDAARLRMIVLPIVQLVRFAFDYLTNTNRRPPMQNVAQRLLDLGRCIYDPRSETSETLQSVSQEDLAAASYLTRAPVNRVLRELQRRGAISIGYGRIEICDVGILKGIVCRGSRAAADVGKWRSQLAGWANPVNFGVACSEWKPVLDASLWFGSLPPDAQERVVRELRFRRFERNETIIKAGETGLGLFVLLSGQAKSIGEARDGRDSLAGFVNPGEWGGYLPVLDGKADPLSLVATQPTLVGLLPLADCREIFCSQPHLYRALATPVQYVLRYLHDYLVETNRRSPGRLIAQRLFDLARGSILPESVPRDYVENLTQNDLAMATGLARPTVNRVCNELSARGIIEIGYRKIRITDLAALYAEARGQG